MSDSLLLQPGPTKLLLDEWLSVLDDVSDYALAPFNDDVWTEVRVPHNWDDYHGYHVVSHGNLHGTAWYRTLFEYSGEVEGERIYAFFEGVGSYATVYVNDVQVGYHAGGRTTFTVDLTKALVVGSNLLVVKAEHPEKIDDLPFVCGGCWGAPNTEGSQPFGIFRPVWLERTGPVRVEPFGVHVLTPTVTEQSAEVLTHTTLSNPSVAEQRIRFEQKIYDDAGSLIAEDSEVSVLPRESAQTLSKHYPDLSEPKLWSPEHPHLYRVVTSVFVDGELSHEHRTNFGLRWVEWPEIDQPDADHNVVSADRRGQLIHNGQIEISTENNGLTQILSQLENPQIKLMPMGVRVFQKQESISSCAKLSVDLQFSVDKALAEPVDLLCEIQNEGGTVFFHQHRAELSSQSDHIEHSWDVPDILYPRAWIAHDPYLHRLLVEVRFKDGTLIERSETLFGIREPQHWDASKPLNLARPEFQALTSEEPTDTGSKERRLRLNGQPLFMNGTCEYENLLGCDHAFTEEQIAASVTMMRSAGFNAFRDAHHPHNLRYYDHWDSAGIVCWTQIGSHVWFDNESFRENYRQIVREWVKERRNHPCILIWGIQNECSMPEAFTAEIRDIIRELDPTSPEWRITTTCNGGKGSDWNVPQEWSGTYGGNFHDYDLKTAQMVGEYGAWRNFAVHTEVDYAGDENDRSETWACAAMEAKLRLGESFKHESIGHFHWIFNTFANPGRSAENFEGPGDAEIGSVNNKGLVTTWHQPSDLYYMFRSNYADPKRDPMVYIVSHTWPDRWKERIPRNVSVYSNCDEVELFNGIGGKSYGKLTRPEIGRHYIWKQVLPETNLLYAVGYQDGAVVVEDLIRLEYLPEDTSLSKWIGEVEAPVAETAVCRINCGADQDYIDSAGQVWSADIAWSDAGEFGWESWGGLFDNVPDALASRGFTMTPVRGTLLQAVYQNYRYGRQYLKYHFKTGPGRFRLRCHFAEPWFGVGGFVDARALRVFDVAINGQVVDAALDIHARAEGTHRALVREYTVEISSDVLTLHFPTIQVNQAILFGIECFAL
jgi:hypothetical protein